MIRSLLLAVTALLCLARPAWADVTVFAAASLKTALDEIAARYPVPLTLVYGGSSALARQIQQGAPAQIFVSANTQWMDVLEGDGQIDPATRSDLLTNRLVLIAPADSPVALDMIPGADLAGALGTEGRLAMGLTEAVPAGIYGRAALETLGIWDSVAARTAQTDNVRAALNLVALKEAPLGIVYSTDAAAEPKVRVVAVFDEGLHPRIVYPAAVVREGGTPEARALLDWFKGPEARDIFARQGFGFPE